MPASIPVKAAAASSVRVRTTSKVDRCADLAELASSLGLGSRLFERRGEVVVEPLGALERLAQHPFHVRVGAMPPADDDEKDEERGHECKAGRADGYTDGDPRCAVAGKEHVHLSRSEAASPAPTVTIIL